MEVGVGTVVSVDHTRLERVREGLRLFAPKTLRQVDAEIRQAGKRATMQADGIVASRARSHGDGDTVGSYKVQVRAGGVRLHSSAMGATVLEDWRAPKSPQGRTLINTLNERYGPPGRVLWRSWRDNEDATNAEVAAIVKRAESELQAFTGKI